MLPNEDLATLQLALKNWPLRSHKEQTLASALAEILKDSIERQILGASALLDEASDHWKTWSDPDPCFWSFGAAEDLETPDWIELACTWLGQGEPRDSLRTEIQRRCQRLSPTFDSFSCNLQEYDPGPPDIRASRSRALSALESQLLFCQVLLWTPETNRGRLAFKEEDREAAARAAAGPLAESYRCIEAQLKALGLNRSEGIAAWKGALSEILASMA